MKHYVKSVGRLENVLYSYKWLDTTTMTFADFANHIFGFKIVDTSIENLEVTNTTMPRVTVQYT